MLAQLINMVKSSIQLNRFGFSWFKSGFKNKTGSLSLQRAHNSVGRRLKFPSEIEGSPFVCFCELSLCSTINLSFFSLIQLFFFSFQFFFFLRTIFLVPFFLSSFLHDLSLLCNLASSSVLIFFSCFRS